jgi:hypothetical protein
LNLTWVFKLKNVGHTLPHIDQNKKRKAERIFDLVSAIHRISLESGIFLFGKHLGPLIQIKNFSGSKTERYILDELT